MSPSKGFLFQGKIFGLTGELPRKELEKTLKSKGATVSSIIHRRVSFVLCTPEAAKRNTQKVRKAVKHGIPVVSPALVEACIAADKVIDHDSYRVVGPTARSGGVEDAGVVPHDGGGSEATGMLEDAERQADREAMEKPSAVREILHRKRRRKLPAEVASDAAAKADSRREVDGEPPITKKHRQGAEERGRRKNQHASGVTSREGGGGDGGGRDGDEITSARSGHARGAPVECSGSTGKRLNSEGSRLANTPDVSKKQKRQEGVEKKTQTRKEEEKRVTVKKETKKVKTKKEEEKKAKTKKEEENRVKAKKETKKVKRRKEEMMGNENRSKNKAVEST